MAWISDKPFTLLEKLCMTVIKMGKMPNHIAFIMDGNRRFASKYHLDNIKSGHIAGFLKLSNVLQWCYNLGVIEVTVYAFSIENFKRSPKEVLDLINLATENFEKLLNEKEKLMSKALCVRVIGDLKLLEPQLQKMIAELMILTKNNTKMYLNIAFAYTSRNEITHAVETVVNGYRRNDIDLNAINVNLLSDCMFLKNPVDILLRTSNEVRLSDFLLWQISYANICFDDVLWPEYSIYRLLKTIFRYQRHCNFLKNNMCKNNNNNTKSNTEFLKIVEMNRIKRLKEMCMF